jgi:plasmid stabilization system protein ParE
MNLDYVLSRQAECDVDGTIEFLLKNVGRKQAAAFIESLHEALELVVRNPYIGHSRLDAAPRKYRFWQFGAFFVVYDFEARPIQVARVIHGARDLRQALRNLHSPSEPLN